MSESEPTPLARAVRRRMREMGIGQKALAERAGLGETYVRDILESRSQSPQVRKLAKLAAAMDTTVAELLNIAATSDTAELVQDPEELVLLRAVRKLPDEERQGILRFIEFRLADMGRGREGDDDAA